MEEVDTANRADHTPPPHLPVIYLTLPGLVMQTARELQQLLPTFVVKGSAKMATRKSSGELYEELPKDFDASDPAFNTPNDPVSARTIFVMSYQYFSRHFGVENFNIHKMKMNPNWKPISKEQIQQGIQRAPVNPDKDWANNLHKKVRQLIGDEAQVAVRNRQSVYFISIQWLDVPSLFLLTGHPMPRGLDDLLAYISLLETKEHVQNVSRHSENPPFSPKDTNPYEMDDTAYLPYCSSSEMYEKWVLGFKIDDDPAHAEVVRGQRAHRMLKDILLRRTYSSTYNRDNSPSAPKSSTIGGQLPPLIQHTIHAPFAPLAKKLYTQMTSQWAKRHIIVQKAGDKEKYIPNGRTLRAEDLLTFLPPLGLLHKTSAVGSREDRVDAFENREDLDDEERELAERNYYDGVDKESFFWDKSEIYQDMPAISSNAARFRWLMRNIRDRANADPQWKGLIFNHSDDEIKDMSAFEVVSEFLPWSPKLQALNMLIADLSLLQDEKVLLWFQYPAIHDLVQEYIQVMTMPSMSLTSGTKASTRDNFAKAFNNPEHHTRLLIGGMKIAGVGMNLQYASRYAILVDSPDSLAELIQTRGRQHRIGQKRSVKVFKLYVPGSHDAQVEE